MAFPTGLPSYLGFTSTHTLAADLHASQHNSEQADITAIATKIGTGASTPVNQRLLRGNGTGTSAWAQADLTTDVTGVLPVANGGNGTTSTTGTGSAVFSTAPVLTGGGSWGGSPTITTPVIADLTNSQHNHQNAAGGGTLGEAAIDWSTFSLNMKSATNGASLNPTNTSQDLASNGVSISFTVAQACNALVTVSMGIGSTTDFEFHPEIRLGGTLVQRMTPSAALGSAGDRAMVRGFTWVVPLTAGANTLSAGVEISSGTSLILAQNGATISALVLGQVTA